MTNLEKIDCAVITTLEAHPDYSEIMTEILTKKLLEKDPFVTAKYFSRANDARAHMIEVSDLDLLAEIIKNAIKVVVILEQRGMIISGKENELDGHNDSTLFGLTSCKWLKEQLEQHPNLNLDDILEKHPEILPLLVSVFYEVRYADSVMSKEELDNPKLDKLVMPLLSKIENDIHVFNN